MAVADAVMPSPPPSRIVVAPMLALARAAAYALPCLDTAIVWVISAGTAAGIVARRVWGEGSAAFVFLYALAGAAQKAYMCLVCLYLAKRALLLCVHFLVFLADIVCDLVDDFSKSARGKKILKFIQDELNMSPRTAVLVGVTYVTCIPLMVAGYLILMMSIPVEGPISHGEKIGSLILDVGGFGLHAVSCLVLIPALARRDWRRSLLRQSQEKVSGD